MNRFIPEDFYQDTVTIASAATQSDKFHLDKGDLVLIEAPAAFTGTAVTIEASNDDGSTWKAYNDESGTQYSITVGGGEIIAIPRGDITGVDFIRLVSDASEGAERTFTLRTRWTL